MCCVGMPEGHSTTGSLQALWKEGTRQAPAGSRVGAQKAPGAQVPGGCARWGRLSAPAEFKLVPAGVMGHSREKVGSCGGDRKSVV